MVFFNINNVSSRTTTTEILKGTGPINAFGIDTCSYMQISNKPIVNNNNNISRASFKIPLCKVVKNTIFINDTTDHQVIDGDNSN